MQPYGIAIDVDGVIKNGRKAVPQAHEALTLLETNKIPYFLFSNSDYPIDELAEKVQITTKFEMSPDKTLSSLALCEDYLSALPKDTPLLIVAAPCIILPTLKRLQMTRCVFPFQLYKRWPAGMSQGKFTGHEYYVAELTCNGIREDELIVPTDSDDFPMRIEQIIFGTSLSSWYTEFSAATDALMRHGLLDPSVPEEELHYPTERFYVNPIKIVISSPDVSYSSDHPVPRITLGGCLKCVEALYSRISRAGKYRGELAIDYLGKPYPFGYMKIQERLGVSKMFMIGDSLTSDIEGANRQHSNGWRSVLVLTGKTKKDELDLVTQELITPDFCFDNILVAIREIMRSHERM